MITPLSKDQIKDLNLQNPTFQEHEIGEVMNNIVNQVNSGAKSSVTVFLAASNAPEADKKKADFVGDGINDEVIFQEAVDICEANGGGRIDLSRGDFVIGDFPNTDSVGKVAVMFKTNSITIELKGSGLPYGVAASNGTKIKLSEAAYNALGADEQAVIFRGSADLVGVKRIRCKLSNFSIQLPGNQKKIMCINSYYFGRVFYQSLDVRGWTEGFIEADNRTQGSTPLVAVDGCVGIKGLQGGNSGTEYNLTSVQCTGFSRNFMLGGEHLVGINLSSMCGVYGYTFNEYGGATHPITLIGCTDERNVNLPLFANVVDSKQQINIIDMNIEREASATPGGVLGDLAKETNLGYNRGSITYTLANQLVTQNRTDIAFFESGHGRKFNIRNVAHDQVGTTATRLSYAGCNLQEYYDTDLKKMFKYINGSWVDLASDPANYYSFFKDFDTFETDSGLAKGWVVTKIEAGSGSTVLSIEDAANGVLKIDTDDANGDRMQIQWGSEAFKLVTGKPLWFEIKLKTSSNADADWLIGLTKLNTTVLDALTDSVHFRKANTGFGGVTFNTKKDNVATAGASPFANMVNDTWMILGFYFDGNGNVTCYANGEKFETVTTNIPDDEELTPTVCFRTNTTAIKTMYIDYIKVIQRR